MHHGGGLRRNHPRMGGDPHFTGKMGTAPILLIGTPISPCGQPADCFITPCKHIHDPQLWHTHTHTHTPRPPSDHPVLVTSNGGWNSFSGIRWFNSLCHPSLKIFFCSSGRVENLFRNNHKTFSGISSPTPSLGLEQMGGPYRFRCFHTPILRWLCFHLRSASWVWGR